MDGERRKEHMGLPPYIHTSSPPSLKKEVTFWKPNLNEFACQYSVSLVNWMRPWMSRTDW